MNYITVPLSEHSISMLLQFPDIRMILFFFISSILFIWSFVQFLKMKKGTKNSCAAYGEVIDYTIISRKNTRDPWERAPYDRRKVTGYKPIIRFTTENGEFIEQQCAHSVSYKTYRSGETVLIYYFIDDPDIFYFPEQEKNLWRYPLIISVTGALCMVACALVLALQIFG